MHTHEEVVGVGVGATNLEQLHQVVELAMNITTDSNWAFLVMRDQLDGPSWFPLSAGLSIKHTTGCTFDSSCKTSRAYDIASASCLHQPSTDHARCQKSFEASSPSIATNQAQGRASNSSRISCAWLHGTWAHLVTKSLNFGLAQLFAAHQALNPAIEGGHSRGLEVKDRRRISRRSPDVFHIGIHGERSALELLLLRRER